MKNREKIIIGKSEKSLIKVENFIEEVCEKYNINDNYFGNFILAVTELYKIVIDKEEDKEKDEFEMIFETEEDKITFIIKGFRISEEIVKKFQMVDNENYLIEKEERSIFLVKTLCDEIEFKNDEIRVIFAIEEITKRRSNYRNKAFSKFLEKKRKTK